VLGVSWCSGHCAVGGALVAAAAGTAAVAGHRPFQQSEARTRSWAVGVELLASDGLPIAWPVGSMERAWAVSAWSSDGTRFSLLQARRRDGLPVSQTYLPKKLPMHVSVFVPEERPGGSVRLRLGQTRTRKPRRGVRGRRSLTHGQHTLAEMRESRSGKLHHDTTFHLSEVSLCLPAQVYRGWPAAAVARPFRMRSPASLDASVAPTAGPAWRCPPPLARPTVSVRRSPSPDSRISFWASIMQVALKPVRTADANRKARARIKLRRARR
jgi:hypothetical protein